MTVLKLIIFYLLSVFLTRFLGIKNEELIYGEHINKEIVWWLIPGVNIFCSVVLIFCIIIFSFSKLVSRLEQRYKRFKLFMKWFRN